MKVNQFWGCGSVCVMLALCALFGSAAPLHADVIQKHVSVENYYPAGTAVDISLDTFGHTDFTIGDVSGDILWEITEKAWWDTTNDQTIISYTIYNDAFAQNVTSVHIPVPAGVVADSVSAPAGWAGYQMGSEIIWETAGTGIAMFESLDTMIVRYPGLQPIVFLPNAKVDLSDDTLLEHVDWVASSVPEPMTICLLALGGLALRRRRR